MNLPASQKEALSLGEMYYFTGKPCRYGHITRRYAPNGSCYICQCNHREKWQAANPEVKKNWDKRYRTRNVDTLRLKKQEYGRKYRDSIRERRAKWLAKPGIKERLSAYRMRKSRAARGCPEPLRPAPAVCECCGHPPKDGKSLCIDHCHASGVFRGWLCNACNLAIGLLRDDPVNLQRAIAYLQKTSTSVTTTSVTPER